MPKFQYHLSTVHYLMLNDTIRTEAYYKTINKYIKSEALVADLGSGSGILSFFAAQKAKKVYSIEITELINEAKKTAENNNLKNIEFINDDIFNVKLTSKLDVIIQEQIGDYLWDEDLVNKVSFFRKKFLKKDGMIMPNIIELYLVPSDYVHYSERVIEYWGSKPYGIDFANFKKLTLKERINDYLHPFRIKLENDETYLSKPKSVYAVNLLKDDFIPNKIEASFILDREATVTGIIGFMKIKFSDEIFFYTNHYNKGNKLTHWQQFFIPMFSPKKINKATKLNFTLYPDVDTQKWKWKFNFIENL